MSQEQDFIVELLKDKEEKNKVKDYLEIIRKDVDLNNNFDNIHNEMSELTIELEKFQKNINDDIEKMNN